MENCGQKSKDPLGVQQRSGVQSQDNAETNLRMVMETKTEIPSCRQAFKTFNSAVSPSIIKLWNSEPWIDYGKLWKCGQKSCSSFCHNSVFLPSIQLRVRLVGQPYDFHFQFNLIDFCLVWASAHEIHTRELCMQSCLAKVLWNSCGQFIYLRVYCAQAREEHRTPWLVNYVYENSKHHIIYFTYKESLFIF